MRKFQGGNEYASILTVPEVADSSASRRKQCSAGSEPGIPSFRTPGRGIRFRRADVEAILSTTYGGVPR